jgi:hypothetical protein
LDFARVACSAAATLAAVQTFEHFFTIFSKFVSSPGEVGDCTTAQACWVRSFVWQGRNGRIVAVISPQMTRFLPAIHPAPLQDVVTTMRRIDRLLSRGVQPVAWANSHRVDVSNARPLVVNVGGAARFEIHEDLRGSSGSLTMVSHDLRYPSQMLQIVFVLAQLETLMVNAAKKEQAA